MDTINKLQFKHHGEIFTGATLDEAREKITNYLEEMWYDSALNNPNSPYRSLFAEPSVFRYAEEGGEDNPYVMFFIGADTNDSTRFDKNKYCVIDIKKTEDEIADLQEELEKAIRSLTIVALDTNTLDLNAEKTEDGTFISGDVKTAKYHVFDDITKYNNLMISSGGTEGPEGLFIYVDLTYDEASESFTFVVTNADGTLKKQTVTLPNNYLTGGSYNIEDESLHLKMKTGEEIVIDCEALIDEWVVEGDASRTPIILTREEVGPDGESDEHHHIEPWQDVLRADVRVADHISDNILHKDRTGRYLYVKGTADNIKYKEGITVKDALDNVDTKVSTSTGNLIYKRPDGIYAYAMLDYNTAENKIIFTYSDGNTDGNKSVEFKLNSVKILDDITYDPVREVIVIRYIDAQGEYQTVEIPAKDIIEEWDVNNEAHSVELNKYRSHGQGKDILTADVKIHDGHNNILEDLNHELYVRGEADNIKYGESNVEDALDSLKAADIALDEKIDAEKARAEAAETALNGKIDQEIADREADVNEEETRAEAAEQELTDKIGSGFTSDPHENVTYKFNELTDRVAAEETRAAEVEDALNNKIDAEIERSIAKDVEEDGRLDSIETNIGEGFGPRNTVRDEIDAEKNAREAADEMINGKIAELSANTEGRLESITSNDNSIIVDNTDAVNPDLSVNLSREEEDGKPNIIKLNADGLYAGVDLSYETTANKLIFKTTNGSKEIQLESVSSIIDMRYDPEKEALIITYMTNGHEIKTVEVPIGGVITEWRVEDGHPHAVQLEKVRAASGTVEQDVLKASVVITDDHDDNILVMDDGTLYVPANTEVTAALSDAINAEIIRASGAESVLDNAITTERLRATSADTALQTAIENEKGRAMNAESELNTTLTSKIEQTATALSAFTQTAVNEEKTRAMAAEGELRQAIQDETARANAADQLLQDAIDDEVTRSSGADAIHDAKIAALETSAATLSSDINSERIRATSAETTLNTKINDETTRAINAEGTLNTTLTTKIEQAATNLSAYTQTAVNEEKTRAMTAEGELRTSIVAETERANAADTVLSGNIQTVADSVAREEARARQAEADIQGNINDNKIEFEDTTSINFDSHQPTVGVGSVITAEVKLHDANDNLIKCGQGLYATARLDYNSGTNKIKLITSAGEQEFQLSAGAIIDNIYFDETTGELVITYHNAEGTQTVKFSVSELFNPWIVQNPSSGSAIELVKTPAASQGDPDELSARVLLTNLDDNAVKIVNNGLYVSSSAMTGAEEIAKCAKAELKGIEKAVIGHAITDCDSGYTYEPWSVATYINSATSFNYADFILDQSIKNVEDKVDEAIEDIECIDKGEKKIYEMLFGGGARMPDCGEGAQYKPDSGSCVISAATSFYEADRILGDQICEILEMWVSGMTCTSISNWVDDGANKKMLIDVRPSHGKYSDMSDDDLYITEMSGDTIEPGVTEFTDTNALRVVCLQDGGGGIIPDVSTPQNGIYLSNVWNCGRYYGNTAQEQADAAQVAADGYNVDYHTDEEAGASQYNYMNNVRQTDIPSV